MSNKFQKAVKKEVSKRMYEAGEKFREENGELFDHVKKNQLDGESFERIYFSDIDNSPEAQEWIKKAGKLKSFRKTLFEVRKEIRKGPRL